MNQLLLIASILLCTGRLEAQTYWSLDDCIRYGVEQNLNLKNKKLDVRIAGENYLESIGGFLPEVNTSGALGKRFGRFVDPKTNLYTSSSFVESNIGLNISLPLFEGFTRMNRLKFNRLNREVSRMDARIKKNDVAYEVMDAFYKLCFEQRMYRLSTEQRKLSEHYMEQMDEYLALGLKSSSDRQEMLARLQSDMYQEKVRENNVHESMLYLKELLNIQSPDSLQINYDVTDSVIPPIELFSTTDIYTQSEESLPEFQAMKYRLKASQRSLALAAGKFSPSIRAEFALNTGYYDTERDESGTIIPISEQLRNNQNKYIGISVSFPILTGLTRFTEVRRQRLKVRQIENDAAQQKITIYAEIEKACHALQAAVLEHQQALERLRAESISLQENEEKWTEGMISVFELMEKRNLYISAKAELSRTRLQYEIKQRTLDFYRTGTFIKE